MPGAAGVTPESSFTGQVTDAGTVLFDLSEWQVPFNCP